MPSSRKNGNRSSRGMTPLKPSPAEIIRRPKSCRSNLDGGGCTGLLDLSRMAAREKGDRPMGPATWELFRIKCRK
jgi:hypothetical protein